MDHLPARVRTVAKGDGLGLNVPHDDAASSGNPPDAAHALLDGVRGGGTRTVIPPPVDTLMYYAAFPSGVLAKTVATPT